MTWLWFCVVAATLRVSLQCANMPGDTTCGRAVIHAMTHDFVLHPDQFIGLSVKSSYTEFQAYFHNSGMHNCPRPCLEMEQACVPWTPNFPGIGQIKDMRFQMAQHPNWWPELSSKSSDKEISKALYTRGAEGIPRVCEDDEAPGHHLEYAEAVSDDTTDSTKSDSVMNAIQELMDRRKDRVSADGGAEDGWAAAESTVTSTTEDLEVLQVQGEVSSEEKPDSKETFTEDFTQEKETSTQEEKDEVEVSPAEEVHEKAKSAEASSETDQSKGDTSWLDSWKGEDALEGSSGDGEESGTAHESQSTDSDHELQWPSHQEHQVHRESHSDESHDPKSDGEQVDSVDSVESVDSVASVDSGAQDELEKSTACLHKGRSFSMLDVPQHNPESVADAQTCQAQCIKMGAAHFLFHEPTQLCHCPPKGAIPMEVGTEFVSGDVDCMSSGILRKSDVNVPRLDKIGLNATPALMALVAFSMLALAIPATVVCRKITRARRLDPSSGFSRLDPLMADLEEARGFSRDSGEM